MNTELTLKINSLLEEAGYTVDEPEIDGSEYWFDIGEEGKIWSRPCYAIVKDDQIQVFKYDGIEYELFLHLEM